ncbi:MAG: frataxin domain-containing protein [Bryobacteraceae bacterium]
MEEQEFRTLAQDALKTLYRKLSAASDEFEFEPGFKAGSIEIEFAPGKTALIVTPNVPGEQVWVSANSKNLKLDWDWVQNAFVLPASGQTLTEIVAEAISRQLGEEVAL